MSVKNFIPTLWSARLLANLDKNLVYANIVNRDYEGEIKNAGDTVKIGRFGDVVIGDYAGIEINAPQDLTSDQTELKITEKKYFNFKVDDVDQAQANISLMDKGMGRAAYAMGDTIDKHIAAHYLEVDPSNQLGDDTTPELITSANVFAKLMELSVRLDEQNVPSEGRFIVVPSWFHSMLVQSNVLVRSTAMGDSIVTNGYVGEVAGFSVYKSNNVPNVTGTKFKILAGHRMAISFAQQVSSIKAYEPEKLFADAVKGLVVYGSKMLEPKAMTLLTADKG